MLTPNVDDIITFVQHVQQGPGLEGLSAEEIRAVSLLLTGYLRLADLNFAAAPSEATADDGGIAEASRELLLALTQAQAQALHPLRQQSTEQCARELDSALDMVLTWTPKVSDALRSHQRALVQALISTRRVLWESMDESCGFTLLYRVYCDAYFVINAPLAALERASDCPGVLCEADVIRNTLNFWLKQFHWWQQIEAQNEDCRAYAQHGRLLSFLAEH